MGKLSRGLALLRRRLKEQGWRVTALWALDHFMRFVLGANMRSVSEITPTIHVGGQYRRRGWKRLHRRGIRAVINMRSEWDDREAGIAPEQYLHLPTEDDTAPSLAQLEEGVQFIHQVADTGWAVFIHCGAGVGRAATMAAAYLVSTGLSPAEAWEHIRRVRPFIRPTLSQIKQIESYAEYSRHIQRIPFQASPTSHRQV